MEKVTAEAFNSLQGGLSFQIKNEIKDKNGRILILQVTIQGGNIFY